MRSSGMPWRNNDIIERSIAPIIEPLMLPIPPKTTITSMSMDFINPKESGFIK